MSVTGTGSTTNTGGTANPPNSGGASSASTTQSFVPGGSLGKNAFLQLLATQLEYQDPLQPTDNTQFVAQLAQFSSLEQMTNVSTQEGQVVSSVNQLTATSELTSAFDLLGNTVGLQASDGSTVSGTVTAVQSTANGVTVTVNGTAYPLTDVQSVSR